MNKAASRTFEPSNPSMKPSANDFPMSTPSVTAPPISTPRRARVDFVLGKIDDITASIKDMTNSPEWANAETLWDKIKIAWDKLIAEPFDAWWNSTGKAWMRRHPIHQPLDVWLQLLADGDLHALCGALQVV